MFVLLVFLLDLAAGQDLAITAAPTFLFKRQQRITDCDGPGHNLFWCPTGECYYGDDGFVGCCSLASCAPRTRCIEYTDYEEDICDHNTGGCVVCSKSEAPVCVTLTNPAMDHYGFYCAGERATVSSSFEYDLPKGAVIRTVEDSPVTTTETDSEDADDDSTTEGDAESETGTDAADATTEADDDITSSDGTFTNPTATDPGTTAPTVTEPGTTDPTMTEPPATDPVADESELAESKNKLKSAIAAAAALGAILATLIILAIAFIWYRKRTRRQDYASQPSQPMVYSQPSSVPGYSHQHYQTVSNPPSASVSPPNTSFGGGSAITPSPTSRADEQMPHIPELGRYRY